MIHLWVSLLSLSLSPSSFLPIIANHDPLILLHADLEIELKKGLSLSLPLSHIQDTVYTVSYDIVDQAGKLLFLQYHTHLNHHNDDDGSRKERCEKRDRRKMERQCGGMKSVPNELSQHLGIVSIHPPVSLSLSLSEALMFLIRGK